MEHNIYIYMLIMAGVTYLIRVLPLTLIRKEIKSTFIRYDLSCNHSGNTESDCSSHRICRGHYAGMVW